MPDSPQDLSYGAASRAPRSAMAAGSSAAATAGAPHGRREQDRRARLEATAAPRVHPSHRRSLRIAGAWVLGLGVLEIAALATVAALDAGKVPGFLPLHTLLETVTVVIAALVFSVGWNAYRRQLPSNLLIIACAFLGVALLNASHLLAYPGMPDFITRNSPHKTLLFWLASRGLAAGALLAVAIRPWRRLRRPGTRYLLLGAVLAVVAALHWLIFFDDEALPAEFLRDHGSLLYKGVFSYTFIAADLAACFLLWRRLRKPQSFNVAGLMAVAATMAMSDFCFTQLGQLTDAYSLVGHLYKAASYLVLYFAIFVETIELPYAQLQESQNQLQATLDAMPEMLFEVGRDGRIFTHHAAQARIHAGAPGELIGRRIDEVLPPAAAEIFLQVLDRTDRSGHSQGRQVELSTPDGRRWFEISASRKTVGRNRTPRFIVLLHDITATKAAEDAIQHLAFYDQLTGLSNRRLLIDRLRQALAANARSGKEGALLFLDLDNFKSLNDTLGHDFGDLLLQQVAQRLRSCVRDGDTVARFGGDEFVVLLEDLSAEALDAAAQAEAVCNKIFLALNRPYDLGGREYRNSPSIGVTLFRHHEEAVEELLKQADIAMYQAKKAGRNTARFFDPQMQGAVTHRAALESELHRAIERRQLSLHYQVQVDDRGAPIGAEVLIRWSHPERGLVPPAYFIPLAEETGLILPIGQWVLSSACAQLKAWSQDPATRHLDLCVNISAKQFRQEDFVTQVEDAVRSQGIDARRLKLELTESMLLENIEETIATMNALKNVGVRFSLDDFGTGYSSLQYLKRLPLDQLKIDQSFVRDLAKDDNDKVIVRTIIAMAQSLNFDVIAEGVETQEQRDLLLSRGCLRFQGFLFGKPVPIDQFRAQLKVLLEASAGVC
jgi:diguanylate cyclase (GGDEF)-like protein/PAS domain S-box-containing protein